MGQYWTINGHVFRSQDPGLPMTCYLSSELWVVLVFANGKSFFLQFSFCIINYCTVQNRHTFAQTCCLCFKGQNSEGRNIINHRIFVTLYDRVEIILDFSVVIYVAFPNKQCPCYCADQTIPAYHGPEDSNRPTHLPCKWGFCNSCCHNTYRIFINIKKPNMLIGLHKYSI